MSAKELNLGFQFLLFWSKKTQYMPFLYCANKQMKRNLLFQKRKNNRVTSTSFSCEVTAAILVEENKEKAAMLVDKISHWEMNSVFIQICPFVPFISLNQCGR